MKGKQQWLAAMLGCVAVAAAASWLLTRGYGETSEHGYAYSMALFSACNLKDEARLTRIAEMIASDVEDGKLSPRESRWLNDIVEKGQRGDWEAANRDVRRLMEDQIREIP